MKTLEGLFIVMLLLYGCEISARAFGCSDNERAGLLSLKAAFVFPNGSGLPSWRVDNKDCCRWDGIECGNISDTLRVTKLQLNSRGLAGALFSNRGLCELASLEELDIGRNKFEGSIPPCISNITGLRRLDLSYNNFGGAIPPSVTSRLRLLEFISFSGNAFEGTFSLASLANNSKLKDFDLLENKHKLRLETEGAGHVLSYQLRHFRLSNCISDKPNGLGNFLMEQHDLEVLELIDCGFGGQFPSWLFENNTNLIIFNLMGNSFSGKFSLNSSLVNTNMQFIDASCNSLEGEIPPDLGYIFPRLGSLNLSRNSLQGRIPSSLCHKGDSLLMIDLGFNKLSGEIPKHIARCQTLIWLLLSSNRLGGSVLPESANMSKVSYLSLSNNRFSGEVSPGLLHSLRIRLLDLSKNNLSGSIPDWIGNFQNLTALSLADNPFKGTLPLSFCNLHRLEFLDLSGVHFGPSIPSCVNAMALKHLHLEGMNLRGSPPQFLRAASSLVTLNLRNNALSDEIPSWFGSLLSLRALLLAGNSFEGHMPPQLCQLYNISVMDLSRNNISGRIPSCISKLAFGNSEVPDGTFTVAPCSLSWAIYGYGGEVTFQIPFAGTANESSNTAVVIFTSKHRLETYEGRILKVMSGLDLSSNNFSGSIPLQISDLRDIRSLNLSNNHLTGSIPATISSLSKVESLDLSHNNLSGEIPHELTELNWLSTFSVASNNLSGRTPELKSQFATFGHDSYEGNAFLCGPPLGTCNSSERPTLVSLPPEEDQEDSFRMSFLWSFLGSYVMAFLGTLFFIFLNSQCRARFFDLMDRIGVSRHIVL